MSKTVTVPREEVAKIAFIKLRDDKEFEAAARLAHAIMFGGGSIVLDLGDRDAKVEQALEDITGKEEREIFSYTSHGYSLTFSFTGEIELDTCHKEKIYREYY